MNISSFNQNWIFQNKIKNKAGKRVNLPHDAMLTEKGLQKEEQGRLVRFSPEEAIFTERICSVQRSTTIGQSFWNLKVFIKNLQYI